MSKKKQHKTIASTFNKGNNVLPNKQKHEVHYKINDVEMTIPYVDQELHDLMKKSIEADIDMKKAKTVHQRVSTRIIIGSSIIALISFMLAIYFKNVLWVSADILPVIAWLLKKGS